MKFIGMFGTFALGSLAGIAFLVTCDAPGGGVNPALAAPTACAQWQIVRIRLDDLNESGQMVPSTSQFPDMALDIPAGWEPFAIEDYSVTARRCKS